MSTPYLSCGEVFPVVEARVVQMILYLVKEEDEQDGGESCDDLTSEELLDNLKKLEYVHMHIAFNSSCIMFG